MTLGEQRKNVGFSQRGMAVRAETKVTYIAHMEGGWFAPSMKMAERLAPLYGVSLEQFGRMVDEAREKFLHRQLHRITPRGAPSSQ